MLERELVRVNVSMPIDLKEWYQEKAYEMGLSMSAFMMISLQQIREQKVATENMGDVLKRLDQLEGDV